MAESSQPGRRLGRADRTASRETLKEKLLSRQPQLPRPMVTLCGHQPSAAARATQDLCLLGPPAEDRRDSPEKCNGGGHWWGALCGKLLSAMSFSLHCTVCLGGSLVMMGSLSPCRLALWFSPAHREASSVARMCIWA